MQSRNDDGFGAQFNFAYEDFLSGGIFTAPNFLKLLQPGIFGSDNALYVEYFYLLPRPPSPPSLINFPLLLLSES